MAEEEWDIRPVEVHALEKSSAWLSELQEVNTSGVGKGTRSQELKPSRDQGG